MFSVIRDDSRELREHVEKYHYLHRWPIAVSLPFGYRLTVDNQPLAPDGRLWGLVVFKKLQHHKQRDLFGYDGLPTAWQVLDLARVWVNPCLQEKSATDLFTNRKGEVLNKNINAFSRMVGASIRHVQQDWLKFHPPRFPELPYHILMIISYCQLDHHDGTGYRASGFQSVGFTQDKAKEIYLRRLKQPMKSWRPEK